MGKKKRESQQYEDYILYGDKERDEELFKKEMSEGKQKLWIHRGPEWDIKRKRR